MRIDEIEGIEKLAKHDMMEAVQDLNIKEKLANIDRQLAEHDRRRQEIDYAPRLYRLELWKVVVTAAAAGAGLFAAGAAFVKFFAL